LALLDEARAIVAAAGATADEIRIGRHLRSVGARVPGRAERRPRTGWLSLTGSELRVARLVADGLTNREVAGRLFLSPHTVDSHLRHAFAKLGIASRVELATIVVANDRLRADAAVDDEVVPDDVPGRVGGQPQHRVGDLLR
jgi:DNA-binding CsgD family transcriptional regulator